MQFLPRLKSLFEKRSHQFQKLRYYLMQSEKDGVFYRFGARKRINLIAKARRLEKRINRLHWEIKLAALGGTVAAFTPSDKVLAQDLGPFIHKDRLENPLRPPLPGYRIRPAIVDLDNDGDYDVVVKEGYSYLRLFNNRGDGTFEVGQSLYTTNGGPYGNYFTKITGSFPSFIDVDADGDMDLVLGTAYYGLTQFYLNNGDGTVGIPPTFTLQTGPWNPITKTGNPFENLGMSHYGQRFFFIDYDGDADLDVLFTERAILSNEPQLFYYENTGSSQFAAGTIPGLPDLNWFDYGFRIRAVMSDIDQDGQLDILAGRDNGDLLFFKGGASSFTLQTGPWNPLSKTGNPFDGVSLLWSTYPTLADFDLDGDQDIIVGYSPSNYQRLEPLAYFENKGNGVFDRKIFLDNPFGGASTGSEGAPYFVDIDGDGQLDALLGGKYGTSLTYYKNDNGKFNLVLGPESPFSDILGGISQWAGAKPVYIDIDDDGDLDLVTGDYYGNVTFFKSDNGVLSKQIMDSSNPFFSIGYPSNWNSYTGNYYSVRISGSNHAAIDLVDIDNDGDLDLFAGNNDGTVDFFLNTGTKSAPHFEIPLDPTTNPLDKSRIPEFASNFFNYQDTQPRFIDLDHDGDWDLLLGGHYYGGYKYYGNAIFYFENIGTPEAASFVMRTPALLPKANYTPYPGLIDIDGDGDLDIFVGDRDGHFELYINENPAVQVTLASGELIYNYGLGSIVVDANLTLSDTDNDLVTKAIVSIQGFQPGDNLVVTPQGNVQANFNTNTGILTLSGVAAINIYQDVLRSLVYSYTGPPPSGAMKSDGTSGRTIVVPKSIQFSVFDSDFTTPVIQSRTVTLTVPNVAPSVVASSGTTTYTGSAAAVDASISVSDPDDADLVGAVIQINSSTFVAVQDVLQFTNQNGITGTYVGSTGTLTLSGASSVTNYQNALRSIRYVNSLSTPASSTRTIDFSVDDGEMSSSVVSKALNINVNNAPTITISVLKTVINNSVSIDLSTIISDQDGNLDPLSFAIIPNVNPTPSRIGNATISGNMLTIDYAGTNFAGTDYVTIQACDLGGLCASAEIPIEVAGNIIVHNGMSPNGDGKNDYFKLDNITTLGPQNKVTIFNRWGDKVFEIEDYDNQNRKFEGRSDQGNDLPSGVYFYRIVFRNGLPELTGYLTLKR